jgi:hypothetical protein
MLHGQRISAYSYRKQCSATVATTTLAIASSGANIQDWTVNHKLMVAKRLQLIL